MEKPRLLYKTNDYEVWGCNWCKFKVFNDGKIESVWFG